MANLMLPFPPGQIGRVSKVQKSNGPGFLQWIKYFFGLTKKLVILSLFSILPLNTTKFISLCLLPEKI